MAKDLNRAVKKGVAWTLVERGMLQFLRILMTVILARLLAPEDYGVMAMALLFTGLASHLMQFGFGMALIQRETVRPDHVSTLFAVTLVINGLLCLSLVAISPYVGIFFKNPLVGAVLALMSLNFLIRCFGVCPTALLRRQMNFKALTVGRIIDHTIKFVVAVTLAIKGHGVWSLAYAELIGAVFQKIYLVFISGWRPSLYFTREALRDLFGFGLGISLKSTFVYLSDNVGNFVIGKWLGAGPLGLYERAYNLMNLSVRELSARMSVILFPAFARIHKDPGRFRAAYRKSLLSLSLFCYPIFGSLVVLAPQVIDTVYGSQWTSIIVPFQILCLAGWPRALTHVTASVINATGSVGPEVKRRVGIFALLILGAIVGSQWGIVGVAGAVTLINFIALILILFLVVQVCPIRFQDIVSPQIIPLGAVLAVVVTEKACQIWTEQILGLNSVGVLAVSLSAGCLVYLAAIYLLRDRTLSLLIEEIKVDLQPFIVRVTTGFAKRIR